MDPGPRPLAVWTNIHDNGWITNAVAQVDLQAGMVRLEVGTTKSGEGRSFYVTQELRTLLQGQLDSIAKLKKRGTLTPYVFHWTTAP